MARKGSNNSKVTEEVGNRIKEWRLKRNMNQEDLAGALGVVRISIVNIEAGRQNITIEGLLKLCAVLKCRFSDILPPVPQVELKEVTRKTKAVVYKSMDANFKW